MWDRIKALCLRQISDWCGNLQRQAAAPPQCGAPQCTAAAVYIILRPPHVINIYLIIYSGSNTHSELIIEINGHIFAVPYKCPRRDSKRGFGGILLEFGCCLRPLGHHGRSKGFGLFICNLAPCRILISNF